MDASIPESTKTVSVVLPYYNRSDTLVAAAQSVLDQTWPDLVLYLVDDGSTDGSSRIAHGIDDNRVRHLATPGNVGASRARNLGLDAATTSLVAFMDSDDLWLPSKLEVQHRYLRDLQSREPAVAIVGCGWKTAGTAAPSATFAPGPHSYGRVLTGGVAGIGTPMLLVDRDVAASGARFDEALPALLDWDYVLSCLSNDTTVAIVPEVLALVTRGRADHIANSRRAARAYEVLLAKRHDEIATIPGLESWYAYRAAREHLLHGDYRSAARAAPRSLGEDRVKRAFHLTLATVGRRKGLAVAERLLPLSRR